MRIQTSFLGTLILATLSLASLSAHAEEVSTTGKGIVGGSLLGAEVVLATEAAFKVQPAWAYVVGGVGGAAAGGVGDSNHRSRSQRDRLRAASKLHARPCTD